MRSPCVVLVCVLLAFVGRAEASKRWEAHRQKPLTVEQAVEAVLRAFKAEDQARLKALAAAHDPDPWLVADELCLRGHRKAGERAGRGAQGAGRDECGTGKERVAACPRRGLDGGQAA